MTTSHQTMRQQQRRFGLSGPCLVLDDQQ